MEDSTAIDFEVGGGGEEVRQLEDWFLWELSPTTEGFDIDGLISGVEGEDQDKEHDHDHGFDLEVTEMDHAKGLCSELCACGDLFVDPSSSTSSNNSHNSTAAGSDAHELNLDISQNSGSMLIVPPSDDVDKEKKCQGCQMSPVPASDNSRQNPDDKRLMRLVKNREAAFQSRKRKKSYVQDLETKCRMWESYCNQLQQTVAFTCAENAILRDELSRSKRQRGGNGVAEPAVLKDSLPLEFPSHLTTLVVAGHLIGIHCLGWLLAALILLFLGEAVKPSGTNWSHTENRHKSSSFKVFINLDQKRCVFESFPGTRSRAFSSCRHRYRKLNHISPTRLLRHLV
uniref:BZIP domain-containing protein n=1 Tax=Araucaria cunninghamii TaxID=56994 RepID=A0A0D6QTW3_ARACU